MSEHLETIWSPTDEIVKQSNIHAWCEQLGLASYSELHQWSVTDRVGFWQSATKRLGIRFHVIGDRVIENEQDPARAVWFPDAKLNIVESCFQGDPSRIAVVSQSPGNEIESLKSSELRLLSNRVANSLIAQGCKKGDRVAVALPMTQLSVPVYLGIIAAGCSVVSIADSFAAPEIATRLEIANAKMVFTYDVILRAGKSLPLYERVAEATNLPIVVLAASAELQVEIREQDLAWVDFLMDDDQFELVQCEANDCMNVLFSSGTTGDPKAIVWSHLTPIRCAIDGHIHHDLLAGDVAAWPTNLGWMMGPWLIFASLINQSTIAVYEDAPMTEGFGKFIETARVNMLGVVPTIVKSWRNSRVMESCDWSAIKCFSSTGETSQAEDMLYLSRLAGSKPIIEYCGGTEIGGGYVTSTIVQPNVASAFSTPSIGLDFMLLDEQFQVAEEGEVYLLPPSIGLSNQLLNRDHFETYFADLPSGPNGETLRRHGDYFKQIGNYFVAGGRTDDTMNLGGIKISSAELERVLNQIDGIRETAAVAVAENHGPDRLVVFTVFDRQVDPKLDAEQLKQQMNQLLKRQLNPLFKVDQIEEVDALPRTASNKVMRRELRTQLMKLTSPS